MVVSFACRFYFYICVPLRALLLYLCNKHCVNNLFLDDVQKSFSEATRSSLREYCGYTLKFAPDRMEAGR